MSHVTCLECTAAVGGDEGVGVCVCTGLKGGFTPSSRRMSSIAAPAAGPAHAETPSSNICHVGAAGCQIAAPTADYVVKMESHSCLFDL